MLYLENIKVETSISLIILGWLMNLISKSAIFFLSAIALLVSQSLFAAEYYPHWLYLFAGGGGSSFTVNGMDIRPKDSAGILTDTNDSEQGAALMGGVGFKFKSIPAGFNVEYIRQPTINYDESPVISGLTGVGDSMHSNLKSQGYFFNIFYDINIGNDYFVPYIDAGVGYENNKVTMRAVNLTTGISSTASNTKKGFAWQGGVGVHMKLINNIFFDLGYQYMKLGRAQWGPWSTGVNQNFRIVSNDIDSNVVYLTVNVFFGDQKENKPPTLIDT